MSVIAIEAWAECGDVEMVQRVAPEEMKALAGRMWWSFYESDATFETRDPRASLCICTTLDECSRYLHPSVKHNCWRFCIAKPFLISLDGLERILVAYAEWMHRDLMTAKWVRNGLRKTV